MVHGVSESQYWSFYLTILAGSRLTEPSVFICSHESPALVHMLT